MTIDYIKSDTAPLVYSTEISRSINVGKSTKLTLKNGFDENGNALEINDLRKVKIDYSVVKAGDLNPSKRSRLLSSRLIVDGIVYGLVNVRTNGSRFFSLGKYFVFINSSAII